MFEKITNLDDLLNLTEKDLLTIKETFDTFQEDFIRIYEQYQQKSDLKKIEKELNILARKYKEYCFAANYFVNFGNELIAQGQNEAGIRYLQVAIKQFGAYADEVTCFLRFAEYYIENGETEKGISYLMKLCCETTDNYEESIEFRELTQVWERYKYLVEGKVPASYKMNTGTKPLKPEECSMQIQDILALPEEDILLELSTHLYELSGCGEHLNYLNKWERLVFYLDTLCADINSDGILYFVDYHGARMKQTKKAMEELGVHAGVQLLEDIQKKRKRRIEDFEDEEAFYYNYVEKDLLTELYKYVMSNKSRFR